MLIFFLIIVIIASALALIYMIYRHFPDLSSLDIGSIKDEKQDRAKSKILQSKLHRQTEKIKEKLAVFYQPLKSLVGRKLIRSKEKILALEKKYHKQQDDSAKPASRHEILDKAEDLIRKEDFNAAEKLLIELIARNKKDVAAYDRLGSLYYQNKSYDQAEEVFRYLINLLLAKNAKSQGLAAADASRMEEMDILSAINVDVQVAKYYDELGQIYDIRGMAEKSLDSYLKANIIEPNNPKYLDKIIELGIKVGDKGLAKKTYRRLKEINPDNAKLTAFGEEIEKLTQND